MLKQLDMENLKVLEDGRLAIASEQELQHVVMDLMDRPGDDRPRSVTLKVIFKPECDDHGTLESVRFHAEVGNKLRSRKSRVIDMQARKSQAGAMLVFNEMSLDDVNQGTLPFDSDE